MTITCNRPNYGIARKRTRTLTAARQQEHNINSVANPERTLQPCNYQLSKSIVHEIIFGDGCQVNINNLPYSDRYFNTNWQLAMFKRGKANGHDSCLVYISKLDSLISLTYVVSTHWNCIIEAIPM